MRTKLIMIAVMLLCMAGYGQKANVRYATQKSLDAPSVTVSYSVDTVAYYRASTDADILVVNTGTTTPTICTVYLDNIAIGNQVVVFLQSGTASVTIQAAGAMINNASSQTISTASKTFFRKNAYKFYMW